MSAPLLLAMADPANVLAVDDVALLTRMDVKPAVASTEDIAALIARMNRFEDAVQEAVEEGEDGAAPLEIVDLRESAEDAPVIKLVHSIIAEATDRGASDIHFEPQADEQGRAGAELRVRMRIDGVLTEQTRVPKRMVAGVVSRIKIMSDLDISERRIPQDGRVGLTVDGRHVDIRVVTIPSVHGESVVLRVLDKDNIRLELDKMGMQEHELTRFRRAFNRAYGAVLVTGPNRIRQVHLAVRRPARAEYAGEEHHHDRGPGRVPDRRASPRFRSTRRPVSGSRRVCAR